MSRVGVAAIDGLDIDEFMRLAGMALAETEGQQPTYKVGDSGAGTSCPNYDAVARAGGLALVHMGYPNALALCRLHNHHWLDSLCNGVPARDVTRGATCDREAQQ